MTSRWTPDYLILHDYGVPKGVNLSETAKNPYNALVYPNGTVRYRTPDAPYTQRAPHAYKLNPRSIGLAYAGAVGGTPTRQGIETLRQQVERVRQMYPNIKIKTHGEAYQATRGTRWQASKLGRGPQEASWKQWLKLNDPAKVAQQQTQPTLPQQAPQPQAAQPQTSQLAYKPPSGSVYPYGNTGTYTGQQPPAPNQAASYTQRQTATPPLPSPNPQRPTGATWVQGSDGMNPLFASDATPQQLREHFPQGGQRFGNFFKGLLK